MHTVIRTSHLPEADRFEYWTESVSRVLMPVNLYTRDPARFRGSMHLLDLGPVQISRVTCSSVHTRRTDKLIRRSDPEVILVTVPLSGRCVVTQSHGKAFADPQGLLVHPTWRPFSLKAYANEAGIVDGVLAMVPRSLLPRPRGVHYDRPMALTDADGTNTVLRDFLTSALGEIGVLRRPKAARLSLAVADLVAAAMIHDMGDDAPQEDASQGRQERLRTRLASIYRFIAENLGDPGLTPATIAAAHHMSTRTLHRLFENEGHTVARWIREQRLERCHRDLNDPTLWHRPIHAIAAGWGIEDAARFARAYRAKFGHTAQEYRRAAIERFLTASEGTDDVRGRDDRREGG
ncbi:AraC-like ligand-binding domain-containing protein [Nonomuraea bangladeshensis]